MGSIHSILVVEALVKEHFRISLDKLATALKESRGSVHHIMQNILRDMSHQPET